MEYGDRIKGDCENCLDDVELEYHYTDSKIQAFVCCNCGSYNYINVENEDESGRDLQ